jgi:hypothetical protein
MTRPRDRQDMIDRSESADSRLPKLANDPTENAESADPTEPIDSTEPTDPMDNTEPFDAMLRTDSLDRIDQREPSPSVASALSVKPDAMAAL